jgi:arginyl-tRNA synthetase
LLIFYFPTKVRTLDEVAAPEGNRQSENLTLSGENSPEHAQPPLEGSLPDKEFPVSENVQTLVETTSSDPIPILEEVQLSDKAPAHDELVVPNDGTTPEMHSLLEEMPAGDGNVPEAIQVCEGGTTHGVIPVDEEVAAPDERVPELSQSSEEGVLPHENSSSEAVGTLDENILEEAHISEEKSPDVPPASEDVSNFHQHDSQDTLIPEEIKPSVEIQVM